MNTSVTAEDLLIHDGGDGQAVEAVGESFPQFDVKSAFTCNINTTVSARPYKAVSKVFQLRLQFNRFKTVLFTLEDTDDFWFLLVYKCPSTKSSACKPADLLAVTTFFHLNAEKLSQTSSPFFPSFG